MRASQLVLFSSSIKEIPEYEILIEESFVAVGEKNFAVRFLSERIQQSCSMVRSVVPLTHGTGWSFLRSSASILTT